MFGKKKKTKEIYEGAENVLTENARYAASSRFRGWLVVFMLAVIIPSAWLNVTLARRENIVVGIDTEGRPQVLERTPAQLSTDVFITDFIQKFLNYSPNTVKDNMSYATRFVSGNFAAAFRNVLGDEFIESVQKNGTVQLTTVKVGGITITDMKEGEITAEIMASRIRSDRFIKETVESNVKITMVIVRGNVTVRNPWGWYVDRISEETAVPDIQ